MNNATLNKKTRELNITVNGQGFSTKWYGSVVGIRGFLTAVFKVELTEV